MKTLEGLNFTDPQKKNKCSTIIDILQGKITQKINFPKLAAEIRNFLVSEKVVENLLKKISILKQNVELFEKKKKKLVEKYDSFFDFSLTECKNNDNFF